MGLLNSMRSGVAWGSFGETDSERGAKAGWENAHCDGKLLWDKGGNRHGLACHSIDSSSLSGALGQEALEGFYRHFTPFSPSHCDGWLKSSLKT